MKSRKRFVLVALSATGAAAMLALAAFATSDHEAMQHGDMPGHHEQSVQMHNDNPLIDEMIVLDAVFRTVVSGVAMTDGPRVYEAIEKMHGTMERTHEGVKRGTVTLRKNADRLKEFVEQDKQFHVTLENLESAAHKNDGTAMLSLTKELLDRCVRCHREFRKP